MGGPLLRIADIAGLTAPVDLVPDRVVLFAPASRAARSRRGRAEKIVPRGHSPGWTPVGLSPSPSAMSTSMRAFPVSALLALIALAGCLPSTDGWAVVRCRTGSPHAIAARARTAPTSADGAAARAIPAECPP